jgi:hypothetical protein
VAHLLDKVFHKLRFLDLSPLGRGQLKGDRARIVEGIARPPGLANEIE